MFLTLEGPEGAGKSTLAATLTQRIEAAGREVLRTREPGAGALGADIRKLLLEGEEIPRLSELFLFLADRAHHVERIIRPALESGKVVLCDRFADSTVVYQGYARGLDIEQLRSLNKIATQGLTSNLTLLLDLPAEVGLSRLQNPDRLDSESLSFHQKVREGFLLEAAQEPDRWVILDARENPMHVADNAWDAVRDMIGM